MSLTLFPLSYRSELFWFSSRYFGISLFTNFLVVFLRFIVVMYLTVNCEIWFRNATLLDLLITMSGFNKRKTSRRRKQDTLRICIYLWWLVKQSRHLHKMKEKNIEQKNQEMKERKVWVSVYCTVKLSRLHEHLISVFQTKICRLWTLLKKKIICVCMGMDTSD